MKTNQEHFSKTQKRASELGSGLVYVLIAVGLFGALSFTLMRTTDSGEASTLNDEQAELYASQLINYTAQAQNVLDQMAFSGSEVSDLSFAMPGEAAYSSGTQVDRIHNVFHPDGGGLNVGGFAQAITLSGTNPTSGWYMGHFNEVEWTLDSSNTNGMGDTVAPYKDIILTAYRIPEKVCGFINDKITGSTTIPALSVDPPLVLVNNDYHTGSNVDFEISHCAACEGYNSLCVSNAAANVFAFYNIFQDRR